MNCPNLATKADIEALEDRLANRIATEIQALEARLVGQGSEPVTLAQIKTIIEDSINLPFEIEVLSQIPEI